jgi:hypothetical protein
VRALERNIHREEELQAELEGEKRMFLKERAGRYGTSA